MKLGQKILILLVVTVLITVGCSKSSKGNFVRIKGGSFTMGSPEDEPGRQQNEGPQHKVTVSNFYMGKYQVTVGEFRKFVNATGYKTDAETKGGGYILTKEEKNEFDANANWENPYFVQTDEHPVVLVSWNDAIEYCNWLSKEEGLTPVYTISGSKDKPITTWNRAANGYRLPTEAEWEYACRAGTKTTFSTGKNITTDQANYNGNYPYGKNVKGEFRRRTLPVGCFTSNEWRLYDMHGNAWDWCWDWEGSYNNEAQKDPAGPDSGTTRSVRGGAWHNAAIALRSAFRQFNPPSNPTSRIGFRVVRNVN